MPKLQTGARCIQSVLADEQAFIDVVAYITTLPRSQPTRTESSGDPIQGKQVFTGCGTCPGTNAQGTFIDRPTLLLGSPRLAGQHDWYLVGQLQAKRQRGVGNASRRDVICGIK